MVAVTILGFLVMAAAIGGLLTRIEKLEDKVRVLQSKVGCG